MSIQDLSEMFSNDRRILVSVDMGTRFSSIAWAESRHPDKQFLVEQWPSKFGEHGGVMSSKVPTELRYTDSGTEWGYQIPLTVARSSKLKLQFQSESSSSLPPPYQLYDEGVTVSDFLASLLKHLVWTLKQNLGAWSAGTVELEFCLTIPFNWKEISKQKFLKDFYKALEIADLKTNARIMLLTEPEAAVYCALQNLYDLKVGDTFVLCDAGGEGAGVISYTVTRIDPTVQVKETASGMREEYGPAEIDQRFRGFLTGNLSREPGWDASVLAEAMKDFESIKKLFFPSKSSDPYAILVPGLSDNTKLCINRGKIYLSSTDLFDIFEPAVGKVIRLVRAQIKVTDTKVKAVLLVGGFGQNAYLTACLRDSIDPSIEILQPANGLTAVARGALILRTHHRSGQTTSNRSTFVSSPSQPLIGPRIVARSYGYLSHVLFDPNIHDVNKKFWSDRSKTWRANAMTWFVKKGDVLKEGEPYIIGRELSISFPSSQRRNSWTYYIFSDSISSTPPVHQTATVGTLVMLVANLTTLSDQEWKQLISTSKDGSTLFYLPFSIEVTHYATSTTFSTIACGKRLATVNVEDI